MVGSRGLRLSVGQHARISGASQLTVFNGTANRRASLNTASFTKRHDATSTIMDYINLVQWPAMAATVTAAWLVASQSKRRRNVGFWVFLVSNALWIVWGWHDGAHALIA